MKNSEENARRWLEQAEHNFKVARKHIENNDFSDACFMAEQATQVVLKAYLYFNGERFVNIHSVTALLKKAGEYCKDFLSLLEIGAKLDQYYIPTRYPDALPAPAVPYEEYKRRQAEEAVGIAKKILSLVKRKIKK